MHRSTLLRLVLGLPDPVASAAPDMDVLHNGCVWRAVPADFPPWRTVYGFYQRWHATGATIALHDALRAAARQAAGRAAGPTAAVIDSQSVRAAATVPHSSRGWDAAKKVNGRKRQALAQLS